MADGEDEAEAGRLGRPSLTYPCGEAPGPGEAKRVAPGVWWLRMAMPGTLDHINVWALEDEGGWTLVDTGLQTRETAAAWRTAFAGPLAGKVRRVIVTHMHPDHIGMAGWLTRKHQVRMWITRLEYVTCRMLAADTGREAPEDAIRFYRGCGWDEEALDVYRERFGGFGRGMSTLPDSYRRIEDGELIRIGGRDWRVVVGNGHSPEHACLWRPGEGGEPGVLISGDQVLPRISSNVSVFPTEPDADPLTDWLDSLAKLKAVVPADVLVLPAHNDPFTGLHARLDHLVAGHERSLRRLRQRLAEPRRAVDVFGALFARPIGPQLLGMATGESLAHLNCLRRRGQADVEADAEGLLWWRAAGGEVEPARSSTTDAGPDLRPADADPC